MVFSICNAYVFNQRNCKDSLSMRLPFDQGHLADENVSAEVGGSSNKT